MAAQVANSQFSDSHGREEDKNENSSEGVAQNIIDNLQNEFEAMSHSNLAIIDTDDRVEDILYGNPLCSLKKTFGLIIKLLLAAFMLGVTCVLMWVFNTNHPAAESTVMFITMNGVAAPFILILVNILITLFFLPGIFGALLCGYSYCFILNNVLLVLLAGTSTCFIGFSIGSIIAMYIGRYLARSCIQKIHDRNKYLRALSICFKKSGLKIMFLLRLSPLIPYNLLNYVMGVYPITIMQFSIANLGMIPGILIYVYIGTAVSSIGALFETSNGSSILKIIMFSIGLVVAVVAIIFIIAYTKRELNKALIEKEKEEANKPNEDQENHLQDINNDNQSESYEIELSNRGRNLSQIRPFQEPDPSPTMYCTMKKQSNDNSDSQNIKSEERFQRSMSEKYSLKIEINPNPCPNKSNISNRACHLTSVIKL
ncbi:unnamed protein product [Moneuplotes crassus]|uniref:VTT domain-containing protein n=1 Tax=Euplotes crassus TaxID=5936 RepID=A0AAD1UPG3_EUPCR|nr:unnamed protein product [Moneuplotes crassus]